MRVRVRLVLGSYHGVCLITYLEPLQIVPLHQIPNARFGEVDGALVRIFFPHLWDGLENQGGSSYVNATVLKPFYDKAVQPAAQEVLGGEVRTWPPNFRSETFRAESQGSGPPQQTGRGVHGGLVNRWIKEIRNNVAKVDCLRSTRDFFFAAEIRGIKASTKHPVPEERLANDGKRYLNLGLRLHRLNLR
jgi:hypothetical protein